MDKQESDALLEIANLEKQIDSYTHISGPGVSEHHSYVLSQRADSSNHLEVCYASL